MLERSLPQVVLVLGIMAIVVAAWISRYDMVAVGAYNHPAVSQQGEVMLLDR